MQTKMVPQKRGKTYGKNVNNVCLLCSDNAGRSGFNMLVDIVRGPEGMKYNAIHAELDHNDISDDIIVLYMVSIATIYYIDN